MGEVLVTFKLHLAGAKGIISIRFIGALLRIQVRAWCR